MNGIGFNSPFSRGVNIFSLRTLADQDDAEIGFDMIYSGLMLGWEKKGG